MRVRFHQNAATSLTLAFATGAALAGCAPAGRAGPAAATPRPTEAALVFREVASEAGVTFRHVNGASPKKYLVEIMGAGVAVFDYDNDGRLDLLFVNGRDLRPGAAGTTPALYRNLGGRPGLRFREVSAATGLTQSLCGMGCAVGDFDNDGWQDVYLSAVLGPGRLLHNRGGWFEDVTRSAGVGHQGRWGSGCAWLDFDRDGDLDLYVASYVRYASLADDRPCIVRAGRRSYCIPVAYEGSSGALYRNDGGAGRPRFTDVTAKAGLHDPGQKALGVVVGDPDADGWPDLFVANDTVPDRLFRNRGGRFHEEALLAGTAFGPNGKPRGGMGIDLATTEAGGLPALAVTNFARESVGYYVAGGPQQMSFSDLAEERGLAGPTAPYVGFGVRLVDLENDGDLDLCAVNGHVRDDIEELEPGQSFAQPALLLRNESGRYRLIEGPGIAPLSVPGVRRGLATGDLDNDGLLDLVATRNGGAAEIWLNRSQQAGHWLALRLRGRRSNRDGLGARVLVRAGEREWSAEVRGGGSYLSESDHALHFGLGTADRVDEIRVHWPSGIQEHFPGGPADRRLTLEEGSA